MVILSSACLSVGRNIWKTSEKIAFLNSLIPIFFCNVHK